MPNRNPARIAEQQALQVVRYWLADRGQLVDHSAGNDPDFRIIYRDGRSAIGEVTTDSDQSYEAMWSAVLQRARPQYVPLRTGQGYWGAALPEPSNIARLYQQLPAVVAGLIRLRRTRLEPQYLTRTQRVTSPELDRLANTLTSLGIDYLEQSATTPDEVMFFPPMHVDEQPEHPEMIGEWASKLLAHPRYEDVARKLLAEEADERHVFLFGGSATPPRISAQLQRLAAAPIEEHPTVPTGITHVWCSDRFEDPAYGSVTALWVRESGWEVVRGPRDESRSWIMIGPR